MINKNFFMSLCLVLGASQVSGQKAVMDGIKLAGQAALDVAVISATASKYLFEPRVGGFLSLKKVDKSDKSTGKINMSYLSWTFLLGLTAGVIWVFKPIFILLLGLFVYGFSQIPFISLIPRFGFYVPFTIQRLYYQEIGFYSTFWGLFDYYWNYFTVGWFSPSSYFLLRALNPFLDLWNNIGNLWKNTGNERMVGAFRYVKYIFGIEEVPVVKAASTETKAASTETKAASTETKAASTETKAASTETKAASTSGSASLFFGTDWLYDYSWHILAFFVLSGLVSVAIWKKDYLLSVPSGVDESGEEATPEDREEIPGIEGQSDSTDSGTSSLVKFTFFGSIAAVLVGAVYYFIGKEDEGSTEDESEEIEDEVEGLDRV